MNLFLASLTLGRGTVVALPDELRRHIWSYLPRYPMPESWCHVCMEPLTLRLADGTVELARATGPWGERCFECCTTPVRADVVS